MFNYKNQHENTKSRWFYSAKKKNQTAWDLTDHICYAWYNDRDICSGHQANHNSGNAVSNDPVSFNNTVCKIPKRFWLAGASSQTVGPYTELFEVIARSMMLHGQGILSVLELWNL